MIIVFKGHIIKKLEHTNTESCQHLQCDEKAVAIISDKDNKNDDCVCLFHLIKFISDSFDDSHYIDVWTIY